MWRERKNIQKIYGLKINIGVDARLDRDRSKIFSIPERSTSLMLAREQKMFVCIFFWN
jgi:hypothetical protein